MVHLPATGVTHETQCICSLLLGTAIVSPALLFAQFDPASVPASQTQPNRPGSRRRPRLAMQDSGPNSGDVGQIMQDKMFLRRPQKEASPR